MTLFVRRLFAFTLILSQLLYSVPVSSQGASETPVTRLEVEEATQELIEAVERVMSEKGKDYPTSVSGKSFLDTQQSFQKHFPNFSLQAEKTLEGKKGKVLTVNDLQLIAGLGTDCNFVENSCLSVSKTPVGRKIISNTGVGNNFYQLQCISRLGVKLTDQSVAVCKTNSESVDQALPHQKTNARASYMETLLKYDLTSFFGAEGSGDIPAALTAVKKYREATEEALGSEKIISDTKDLSSKVWTQVDNKNFVEALNAWEKEQSLAKVMKLDQEIKGSGYALLAATAHAVEAAMTLNEMIAENCAYGKKSLAKDGLVNKRGTALNEMYNEFYPKLGRVSTAHSAFLKNLKATVDAIARGEDRKDIVPKEVDSLLESMAALSKEAEMAVERLKAFPPSVDPEKEREDHNNQCAVTAAGFFQEFSRIPGARQRNVAGTLGGNLGVGGRDPGEGNNGNNGNRGGRGNRGNEFQDGEHEGHNGEHSFSNGGGPGNGGGGGGGGMMPAMLLGLGGIGAGLGLGSLMGGGGSDKDDDDDKKNSKQEMFGKLLELQMQQQMMKQQQDYQEKQWLAQYAMQCMGMDGVFNDLLKVCEPAPEDLSAQNCMPTSVFYQQASQAQCPDGYRYQIYPQYESAGQWPYPSSRSISGKRTVTARNKRKVSAQNKKNKKALLAKLKKEKRKIPDRDPAEEDDLDTDADADVYLPEEGYAMYPGYICVDATSPYALWGACVPKTEFPGQNDPSPTADETRIDGQNAASDPTNVTNNAPGGNLTSGNGTGTVYDTSKPECASCGMPGVPDGDARCPTSCVLQAGTTDFCNPMGDAIPGSDGSTARTGCTTTGAAGTPTISAIADTTTTLNTPLSNVSFAIADTDSTLTCATSVTAVSSNTTLVPVASVVITGTAPNCTATVTPATNQSGAATITLRVTDGTSTATEAFELTVSSGTPSPSPTPDGGTVVVP